MSRSPIEPAARHVVRQAARRAARQVARLGHAIGGRSARAMWAERLRIYLGHDALALCHVAGRVDPSVQGKAILRPDAGASGLPALLSALDAWLEAHPVRADLDWIVGSEYARYLLLPWDDRLASDAFCRSLAAALLAQQGAGGVPLAGHQLRFSPLRFGRPRLAALIASDVILALGAFARHRGCRTVRIAPALSVVWNRFHARFRQGSGVLALIEGPRLLRIGFDHGHITAFSIEPFSGALSPAMPGEMAWLFPACHPGAPAGGALVLDGLAVDDDPRLAYALCGVA